MKNLFKVLKILFFLFAIFFIIKILRDGFNSQELKSLIFKASYFNILLSMFLTVFGTVLKGRRLQILAKEFDIKNNLLEFIKIQIISITFALITPGRAGEFTKVFLLAKDRKDKISAGTIITIFERGMDVLILTIFGLILSIFTIDNYNIIYALIFCIFAIITIFILIFKIDNITKKLSNYMPRKIANFFDFFGENKSKLISKLPEISVYTMIIWCIDALIIWSIFISVGSEQSYLMTIGINAIVVIMSILTILPFGLGTMDVSALYLYSKLQNVPHEIIVFELVAARIFILSTFVLMISPFILYQKELFNKLMLIMRSKKKET